MSITELLQLGGTLVMCFMYKMKHVLWCFGTESDVINGLTMGGGFTIISCTMCGVGWWRSVGRKLVYTKYIFSCGATLYKPCVCRFVWNPNMHWAPELQLHICAVYISWFNIKVYILLYSESPLPAVHFLGMVHWTKDSPLPVLLSLFGHGLENSWTSLSSLVQSHELQAAKEILSQLKGKQN